MLKSSKEIVVWQHAVDPAVGVYYLTRRFPADERFGTTAQLRRGSAPSSIAEDDGRQSRPDDFRMLGIARGSLAEIDTQWNSAARLASAPREEIDALVHEFGDAERLLAALIRALRRSRDRQSDRSATPAPIDPRPLGPSTPSQ